jgi:hypothetical protein
MIVLLIRFDMKKVSDGRCNHIIQISGGYSARYPGAV